MNKGLMSKAAVVGLSLFVGVACSHKSGRNPAPDINAQNEQMFKKEGAPTFNAKDKTFSSLIEGADLNNFNTSPSKTGTITLTVMFKGIASPITFNSESLTYASMADGHKETLSLVDPELTEVEGQIGGNVDAQVWCRKADCSVVAVMLSSYGQVEYTKSTTAKPSAGQTSAEEDGSGVVPKAGLIYNSIADAKNPKISEYSLTWSSSNKVLSVAGATAALAQGTKTAAK